MNRIYLLFAIAILCTQTAFADVSSTIEEVTVYRNNAAITRNAQSKVPAGTSEIILTDISTSINPASLQVKIGGNNVTLLSAVYENNYLESPDEDPKVIALKDSLEFLDDEIRWVRDQRDVYVGSQDILNKNKELGTSDAGFTAMEVGSLADNYETRLLSIKKKIMKLDKEEKGLNEDRARIQNQLNDANANFWQPSGSIKLLVSSVSPTTAQFECTYTVNNAGWYPSYDLRSEGTDQDVSLAYKANIYQNTGYNWDRVEMTVSTGNPSSNNNRPIMSPLYVDYYSYNSYGYTTDYKKKDAERDGLAVVNMAYMDAPSEMVIEEVVVAGLVSKNENLRDGFGYDANLVQNQMNVEFEIGLPQDVPSDGKYHLVGMDSYTLPSEYIYHAVPKLDKNAFLLAKINDWGQYNLLEGKANIFFEGAYIGETYINPNVTSDTLLISMGRDESIYITRTQLKDFSAKKFLGSNVKETYGYEIKVRNNKNHSIDIEVLDQIPISNQKDISVELEEMSAAKYTEEYGKLEWNLTLSPNETIVKKLVYSVKYPKNETITGQQ